MRRQLRGAATALVCIAVAAAWRPLGDPLTIAPESKLWFEGKSTVRDWSCKATKLDAAIEAESGAVAAVLAGTKAVTTVTLTVPIDKIDCQNNNGTMQGHMKKALNAEKHPAITFALTGYDLTTGAATAGTLQGTLTINGVAKPVSFPVEFTEGAGGALRMQGQYPLTMTEWNVQPPKLMLGTLKVNPLITVHIDLLLK